MRTTSRKSSRTAGKTAKRVANGWGGARQGAGRKKTHPDAVPHRAREVFSRPTVVQLSVKFLRELGKVRRPKLAHAIRDAIAGGAEAEGFRVCHYSVQSDRLHLLVEADSSDDLSRGMQGLLVRVARRINAVLDRTGTVFASRYTANFLTSPAKVREGLVLVLQDARSRGEKLDAKFGGVDPFSSGWYFDGWSSDGWRRKATEPSAEVPVAAPKTALLKSGWRKLGPIAVNETLN